MKFTFLSFFLAFSFFLQAQQYTYISDRRFFEPADMIGYDFKPSALEIPDETKMDIDPGEYSFGITFNYLYAKGEDVKGVYNINNMQPADYGFKVLLMNARDARLQGHLKVIQNKYGMVEALIFKRSSNDKEVIFYLPPISKNLRDKEKAYFTDRGELVFEDKDSIWGEAIRPFHIMHMEENVQQRLQLEDSTYITFTEEVTIVEKEVKKKKKTDKEIEEDIDKEEVIADADKEVVEEAKIDSVVVDENGEDVLTDSTTLDAPEIKIKITKEYFLTIHSYRITTEGLREKKEEKYTIRKINEKEDEAAKMHEEKYLWEFQNDEKEVINLYLNGDRTVSTLEIGEKKYLVRGF